MKPEPLGNDRWRVRLYWGTDPTTGHPIQKSRSFQAKGVRAATKKAREVVAQLEAERDMAKLQRGTLNDLADRWLQHGDDWSPTTRKRYEAIAKTIKADLGSVMCDKLTTLDVDEWYRLLRSRGLAQRTVFHHRAVLRAMLRQGVLWGYLPGTKAIDQARKPKPVKAEIRPPTDEAVRLLISTARGYLRSALILVAHTGARRGEIVGLRWSDFTDGIVTIRRSALQSGGTVITKMPKGRTVRQEPVSPILAAELAEQYARQVQHFGDNMPADWFVFADFRKDPTGQTPRRPDWLSLAWDRHRKAHKCATVRLHDLRHWHATALNHAGVPMSTISKRLGHAQTSTTSDIYTHTVDADDLRAAEIIAELLALPAP